MAQWRGGPGRPTRRPGPSCDRRGHGVGSRPLGVRDDRRPAVVAVVVVDHRPPTVHHDHLHHRPHGPVAPVVSGRRAGRPAVRNGQRSSRLRPSDRSDDPDRRRTATGGRALGADRLSRHQPRRPGHVRDRRSPHRAERAHPGVARPVRHRVVRPPRCRAQQPGGVRTERHVDDDHTGIDERHRRRHRPRRRNPCPIRFRPTPPPGRRCWPRTRRT